MTFKQVLHYGLLAVGSTHGLIALAQVSTVAPPPAPIAGADTTIAGTAPAEPEQRFAAHGQLTVVEQATAPFHDPYHGTNSLSPGVGAETVDLTLYLGARLWSGAEAWINPEIDQGFGLDDTVGLAGFPSGAAYKVGRSHPYWRLPRWFMRQTLNLSGESETLEADANQFAGRSSSNRWVFTLGKISVPDIFDANDYAHDPRHDFMNWTAIDAGTFDYAAESWGYSVGAAAEWYQSDWTVRAGLFDLSDVPNSEVLDPGFHEFEWLGELEHRQVLAGQPGKLLVTLYDNRARMAELRDAIALAASSGQSIGEALISARSYRSRSGVSMDLQQQLVEGLGIFARAGKASGHVETYEFTDVDQSISAGLSLKGGRWSRVDDTVGIAGVINSISGIREQYLNDGGLGILVGDGRLPHPGPERIIETYYAWGLTSWAQLTLDYQYVINPAYNSDRGPVSIFAARLHAQF